MSKNTIIELSEEMSNLIAAGEVVERPSSVIKELVENSLDANAHAITIELENGGLKKMVVSDNGIGMTKEELPLAIKRHATSKIKSPQDLFNITTLGFRGEALPSIASVSKFTIASSTNELDGYKMIYHGGTIITESPVGMTKGTKVEVVDLFYNTPARFKHLSSMTVELSHIVNYINRQALARPEIAFKLSNNGKQILKTSGDGNIEEIISETFGYEVAKNIIPFEGHNDLYQIKGFTTTNVINRSNRNGINLIINGRIIKNLNLTYAITDAYQTILPTGKYPITILEISCDPSFIDVNVHPSKMEIRFTDEFKLRDLITKTISVAITKKELITDQLALSSIEQEHKSTSLCEDEQKKVDELPSETLWEMFECAPDQENKKDEELKMNEENSAYSFAEDMESEETKINEQLEIPSLLKEEPHHFFQNFTYIGQFLKTYLLMEYDENLYLIDQHAAMERFMYEKISQELSIDHH